MHASPPDDHRATLRLLLTRGVGPTRFNRLLTAFGSPTDVFHATTDDIAATPSCSPKIAAAIRTHDPDREAQVDQQLKTLDELQAHLIVRGSSTYPPALTDLPDAPPVLFVRGTIELDTQRPQHDRFSIAIVGSRKCSIYGAEQTRRFAAAFARNGATVVSGGARGIDGVAHETALQTGGRTIVVLGCGLSHVYPPEHRDLFDRIVSTGQGAIVSEFPVDTPPTPENFPKRNRIIAGLSLGTLVIEASERSGALITARVAVEDQGRDAFALPGRLGDAMSAGTNDLIKRGGAALATDPADVLTALAHTAQLQLGLPRSDRAAQESKPTREPMETRAAVNTATATPTSALHAAILVLIGSGATFDQLLQGFTGTPAELQTELTMLELDGFITRQGPTFIPARR